MSLPPPHCSSHLHATEAPLPVASTPLRQALEAPPRNSQSATPGVQRRSLMAAIMRRTRQLVRHDIISEGSVDAHSHISLLHSHTSSPLHSHTSSLLHSHTSSSYTHTPPLSYTHTPLLHSHTSLLQSLPFRSFQRMLTLQRVRASSLRFRSRACPHRPLPGTETPRRWLLTTPLS